MSNKRTNQFNPDSSFSQNTANATGKATSTKKPTEPPPNTSNCSSVDTAIKNVKADASSVKDNYKDLIKSDFSKVFAKQLMTYVAKFAPAAYSGFRKAGLKNNRNTYLANEKATALSSCAQNHADTKNCCKTPRVRQINMEMDIFKYNNNYSPRTSQNKGLYEYYQKNVVDPYINNRDDLISGLNEALNIKKDNVFSEKRLFEGNVDNINNLNNLINIWTKNIASDAEKKIKLRRTTETNERKTEFEKIAVSNISSVYRYVLGFYFLIFFIYMIFSQEPLKNYKKIHFWILFVKYLSIPLFLDWTIDFIIWTWNKFILFWENRGPQDVYINKPQVRTKPEIIKNFPDMLNDW